MSPPWRDVTGPWCTRSDVHHTPMRGYDARHPLVRKFVGWHDGRVTSRDGRSTRESLGGPSGDDAVRETLTRLLPERLHRLQRTTSLPVVFGGAVRNTSAGPRLVIDRLVGTIGRSEEHTSELQSLMRNSYADFCLKN